MKLKSSTLDNQYKSVHISWYIVFTIQLSVVRETNKTIAAIGCEWITLMEDGWTTLIDRVNKPKRCIMVSYYNNGRSRKYQKHQNKTDNLDNNTSSNYNNNSKNNNVDESTNKNSYKNYKIITTMKIM